MSYSDFKTLAQAVQAFELNITERHQVIDSQPLAPSPFLQQVFERELNWAIAVATEQSRREALTHNILLEVREHQQRRVSVFSGKDFTVDPSAGLNGYCDYLISLSATQSVITAPVMVIAEAKKGDVDLGLGQCVAGMVGAQRFNQAHKQPLLKVYGAVTSGTVWKFLALEQQTLQLDLTEYAVPPVDTVLGILAAITEVLPVW